MIEGLESSGTGDAHIMIVGGIEGCVYIYITIID